MKPANQTDVTINHKGKPLFHFTSTESLSRGDIDSIIAEGLIGVNPSMCTISINGESWNL